MEKNFFDIKNKLESAQAKLKDACTKVENAYENGAEVEDIENLEKIVDKYKKTVDHYQKELNDLDEENKAKLKAQNEAQQIAAAQASNKVDEGKKLIIDNKANIIRSVMNQKGTPSESLNALGGSFNIKAIQRREATPVNALKADSATGGANLLPTTSSSELITEPFTTNKLRNYVTISQQSNLEIPKLTFSCADDDFIEDGETAKEIEATGAKVLFGRFENKVFTDVTDTMLLGTNTDLVSAVERGLDSGVQSKEKKMLFAKSTDSYYKPATKHMSFYEDDGDPTTPTHLIKDVKGATLYDAITNAIADLHEDYRENAAVVMRYSDYVKMLKDLSNGSQTLFGVQPEQIIGKPTIFMDSAEIPIVGNLAYLQINYFPETITDRDKNVKTGINTFALTAWYDIQFKLRSAFRLAVVGN